MKAKQEEARARALAEIDARRDVEDAAARLGSEYRDIRAALNANQQQMVALVQDIPPRQVTNIAKCLKVSRATVHRWRKPKES